MPCRRGRRRRVARVDRHAGRVLGDATHPLDVPEVEGRVDPLGEQVHGERHDVDVPGPLSVPEQRALDAVCPGQHGELGAATAVPRSLCGCRLKMTESRLRMVRPNHSITSA